MWIFIILLAISEASKIYMLLSYEKQVDQWTNKFVDLKRENDKLKMLLRLNGVDPEKTA